MIPPVFSGGIVYLAAVSVLVLVLLILVLLVLILLVLLILVLILIVHNNALRLYFCGNPL